MNLIEEDVNKVTEKEHWPDVFIDRRSPLDTDEEEKLGAEEAGGRCLLQRSSIVTEILRGCQGCKLTCTKCC